MKLAGSFRFKYCLTGLLLLVFCLLNLQSQERFRRNPPYPDPLNPMKVPPIESGLLTSGLRVVTISRSNRPLFNLLVIVQAGENDSPRQLPGLATVTAEMLLKGTLSLSSSAIEEQMESLGLTGSIEVRADYILYSFSFLEENLEASLRLIGSLFYEPAFSSLELAAVKRGFYYQQVARKKDPEKSGYDFFLTRMFAGTGYNPGVIDEDSIRNISQKDAMSFHQRFIRPNNSIIVLDGNINLNNASLKISRAFSRWVSRPLDRPSVPRIRNLNYETVAFLDLPSPDVSVIIGNAVSPPGSDDYHALLVLNQLLGGSPSSRLFLNLRESKGLAYYAFSHLSFFKNNGLFWIRVKSSPESVGQVVKEILSQLNSLLEERIDPHELEKAKAFLAGNFPLENQLPEQMARRIGLQFVFQLPSDFWNKYYENLLIVSSEKVQEVARQYLTRQPLVVISGDFQASLNSLRAVNRIEIYNQKGQLKAICEKGVVKNENR
ncbi:MAG TPA: pitrilysin family protein [Candidatus Saccharicenans sp.]|jgi:predicted Zn-dependent peptidase|nr:insulinase family protein [Candidatus Saccharicenans sp.]HRD01151.1 pitrilysin family protein [Candidatus Saccharicenans sp.]